MFGLAPAIETCIKATPSASAKPAQIRIERLMRSTRRSLDGRWR